MRVAIAIVLMLIPSVVYARPVRVCEWPDKSLVAVYWPKDIPGATPPDLIGLPCSDQDTVDLPPTRARRNAWRLLPNGKVFEDPTIETPQEKSKKLRASAKAKLKAGQPLTPEEADELIP